MTDTLTALVQKLDARQARFQLLDQYYAGRQPLAFLAPAARDALGGRLDRMAANLCRLTVGALTERLRITGFSGADVWPGWLANDLDQQAPVAHREALTLGSAYVIVWTDRYGAARVTVESARQVVAITDPGDSTIRAALKRWTDPENAVTHAVLYGPDAITLMQADGTDAVTGWRTLETIANPLGVVPVVELRNADRLLSDGHSELDDLVPLVDALNKLLADLMVGSEYFARPRRWATGIELEEDADGNAVNPYPEGNRMMLAEAPDARFGQLEAATLAAYGNAVDVILGQIMAVSSLPPHMLGVTSDNPASADALRASEASLTARAEAKQAAFGRAWESVARLMVAVETGADPATVQPAVQWADPSTRSVAQEADAVVKLFTAGIIGRTTALRRLGYNTDEIDQIRTENRTDGLDTAGIDLKALVS